MRHTQFVSRQLVSALLFAIATSTLLSSALAEESSRLMTYEKDGQTYYAMSLLPEVASKQVDSSSIVVMFDTSASQQGAYREAAMNSLETLLSSLRPNDQVELLAVDLGVKAMTQGPTAPGSEQLSDAVELLSNEIPLGSTDLAGALSVAAEKLRATDSGQRTVIYIGDGISVANLLDTTELTKVVEQLRDARVSVSSFAVGPKLDAQLLAVLANQTGGNLYVQADMVWQNDADGISDARAQAENMRNAQIAGQHLAKWAAARVLWPAQVQFASELGTTYPATVPPLRTDRDTVVLGVTRDQLPTSVVTTVQTADSTTLNWNASPEQSQEDHAFLAEIVKAAELDEGLSLPTVGTVGLMESARLVGARMDQLTRLAERAVALGDHETAKRIADAVLDSDPGNVQARTVQFAVEQPGPVDQLGESILVEPAAQNAAPTPVAAPSGDISLVQQEVIQGPVVTELPPMTGGGLLDEMVEGGELLDRVEQERRVFVEMLSKEIQNTLIDARGQISTNPKLAIQDLKLALESTQRVADLDAGKRAELVSKLRGALKEAYYQASLKEELDRQREEQLAASRAQKLANERLTRRIEREKQLMDRFNALVDERRYIEAQEVAQIVEEIDPEGVTPRVATHWARQKRHEYLMAAARAARWQATWDTMYEIELTAIPFSGEPPIIYPEADVWEELTKRRERWASVDLSAQSKAEERILSALRSPLKRRLSYEPEQLDIIMDEIEEDYGIPIVFNKAALDEVAISPEAEVNIDLDNVSLRSALNIMFKEPGLEDLTYVIDDEVLQITTKDDADATLKVKVYPVADLVLPVETPPLIGGAGGGGGGGLGGGGGGGGLGGGGGGGLGGGGGGGFGGGGGGGGGFFNVADEIEADQPKQAVETASAKTEKINWQARFATGKLEPTEVRELVRQLMKSKQRDQAIELIQAALQHGQAQSWMYESLGIAMELEGRPKSEIERVIMSACDFSDSAEELMLIANYLAHIGIDSRAVEVYRQVVKTSPLHHEAYAFGLRAAQRAKDLEGIRWATVGVLSSDLPADQQAVTDSARRVAKSVLDELKREGKTQEYQQYYSELETALARDIIVRASWSGNADVDLIVEEPGGSVCSLHKPRTSGGGVSLGDDYSSYHKDSSKGYTEQYTCAQGFPGEYRVRVRKVWGDVVADKVTIEVFKNFGSKNQKYEKQRISIPDDSDAMVIFELEQSRREKPLETEKLEVALRRQDAISQAVLAQQLAGISDPRLAPPVRGGGGAGNGLRDRLALAGVRGAVGFQPIIQTLPSGRQMQVTGVVSPDRRYVRIAASPSFTGIGNVQTFTFAGAPQQGGQGGGGGLGGGGGGGGLGGGGGGGI